MASHDAYKIAWICALPLEMTAAKAMLDDIHRPLPQPPTDHNTYTLGRIGAHNVVIACLPSGIYGEISAATVLAQMLPTFQSLRFGLMVGIGGGVPSKADIRLGDVVVSQPTATVGGVIQYDLGKTMSDGRFHRTGCLNKPPQLLLTAISQIRSDHMAGRRPVHQIVETALANNEAIAHGFSRPHNDWLFRDTYKHLDDTKDCATCDQNELITDRPPRATTEPHIYYGLIASGNQVIKDAQSRDRIANELDILCFEMEAAGLMDQLPCLVIRGICDYCDSHKKKDWQGYAALTAAAYARELLMTVPIHEQTDRRGRKRLWMVPFSRNSLFSGRQDKITKVESMILMPHGPWKIALSGLGGVGKTQIALEVAYRMRDQNPNCSVFWIPAVSQESVEQAYMTLAGCLGLENVRPSDVKTRVKMHLSDDENIGQWLMIYDNVDDPDMWSALKTFIPQSDQGRIIFTTRNRQLANRLAPSQIVPVSEMDEKTGRETLQKYLVQKDLVDDDATTKALLQQLTFLPLAISQAAAYINERCINLADYLELLQEQEEDIVELLSENFEDDGRYAETQNPVATTWLISFRHIEQISSLAAEYLSFMACINPRDIPQFFLPPAESKKKMFDALGLLKAYSFTSTQKDGCISLHRLVYLATRNWMRKEEKLDFWIRTSANRLGEILPDSDQSHRKLWRELLPHALSLIQEFEFQKHTAKYIALLSRVGYCLYMDGRYQEAEGLQQTVMEISRQIHGSEHRQTLISMNNIASTYIRQGRFKEAEALEVKALEIGKRLLGLENPHTLTSMNNLALTYKYQDRCQEAEALQVKELEICKQLLGPENPHTLTSMNNLASTYCVQGRFKEAEALQVKELEICKQLLGPEDPDTLTSMDGLAFTYYDQGRWKEAEELHIQTLETRKEVLGPEHPDALTSMNNIAAIYYNQGRFKEAENLQMHLLEICKRVLGTNHHHTLSAMDSLAYTWKSLGKSESAIQLMTDCVKLSTRYQGPEHPHTLSSRTALEKWQGMDNASAALGSAPESDDQC